MKRIMTLMSTDHLSGPLRQLLQLVDHVQPNGRYAFLLCFTWLAGLAQPKLFAQIRAKSRSVSVVLQHKRFDRSLIRSVRELFVEMRIDLLQTHGYKPSILGFFLKRSLGIPWVAFLHGNTSEDFKVRCYFFLEKLAVRKADAVVTVSEAMRHVLLKQGFPPNKVHVLRNAIDPEFLQTVACGFPPEELSLLPGHNCVGPLIGIIGRMSPEKGHAIFLEAFPQVLAKVPTARTVFIGTGQEGARLRKMCAEKGMENHVHFMGFQEDVAAWYPALDLVVLPSLSEGLPNVAMEAMLFGKPVVATNVGGVPEVVEDGVTGKVVPPRDATALADAVIEMLSSPGLMDEYGTRGRKKVLNEFSPQARASRMMEIYDEVLSKNARQPNIQ
ncbi:MAG: glycosyltransferase family 4 protein [Desulfomicrobium sp.]|nr:glycosyltransferase family 4 protein [Desulfomicrobium sp.]